jgi:DNA-binding response OmpR family regulator
MNRPRVLVVEDEPDLRTALRIVLGRADMEVLEAAEGGRALRLFHAHRPDLIILDVGLPDLDGWQVLERIRQLSDVPVMMLTARGLESEKVRGLQAGADDYVTKPFGNAEVVARARALLRRSRSDDLPPLFDDGFVRVDFEAHLVTVAGVEVELTAQEYRLLAALVGRSDHILSPEQLLDRAWNDPDGIGPDRVKFTVARLRRKLGESPAGVSPIESVRGLGYRYRRAS